MRKFLLFPFILVSAIMFAQNINEINIVPAPAEVIQRSGYFNLNHSTIIIANSYTRHNADMLNFYLKKLYGFTLLIKNISPYQNTKNVIELSLLYPEDKKKDEYHLTIESNKINIRAITSEGIFYGIQTLLQLLPTDKDSVHKNQYKIPQLTIKDYPRFVYRGMHLDIGRH